MKCEELHAAVAKLEGCAADFDAIEQQIKQMQSIVSAKTTADRVSQIRTAQEQVTSSERQINRQLSHFNKAVNRQPTQPSLDLGPVSEGVMAGIDEVVRKHLYEWGYASVARQMHLDRPAMAQDYTAQCYKYEAIIRFIMSVITRTGSGPPFVADPVKMRPESASFFASFEKKMAPYYHKKPDERFRGYEGNGVINEYVKDIEQDAAADAIEAALFSREWFESKMITYEFYSAMSKGGVEAALKYLRENGKPGNPALIPELAGKLVTLTPSSLEEEKHKFLLDLRTEIFAAARGHKAPATDLDALISAGKIMIDQGMAPLLASEWKSGSELPVDIDMPPNLRFHPLVVCPVTKEQIPRNGLGILACGHILSKEAVAELMGTAGPGAMKCPYCETVSDWSFIRHGYLLDVEREFLKSPSPQ